jgi:hypothetical protein
MKKNRASVPGAARLQKGDDTSGEAVWDHPAREDHCPSSENMFGGRVKRLITLGDGPVGAMSFGLPRPRARALGPLLRPGRGNEVAVPPSLLINNGFPSLPRAGIRNPASHALTPALRRVNSDWKSRHGVEPSPVETFKASDTRGTFST